MSEFFHMGGYAFHVWTSWGLSFLLLGALSLHRYSAFRRQETLIKTFAEDIRSRSSQS